MGISAGKSIMTIWRGAAAKFRWSAWFLTKVGEKKKKQACVAKYMTVFSECLLNTCLDNTSFSGCLRAGAAQTI